MYNNNMNYNQVLGVSPDASSSEIQAAFRKAALEVHPDHSDSPEAAEAFGRIKAARDELMKRAEVKRDVESVQVSTNSAIRATTNAAFSSATVTPLFDGFTPEEIKQIQELDELVAKSTKRSIFARAKESAAVRRHRKKINTINDRIIGKY